MALKLLLLLFHSDLVVTAPLVLSTFASIPTKAPVPFAKQILALLFAEDRFSIFAIS
jgi:hypothetical protein